MLINSTYFIPRFIYSVDLGAEDLAIIIKKVCVNVSVVRILFVTVVMSLAPLLYQITFRAN